MTRHPSLHQKQVQKKLLRTNQRCQSQKQNLLKLLRTLPLKIQPRTQEAPHLNPFLKPFLLRRQLPRRKRFQKRQHLTPKRSQRMAPTQTQSLLLMINQAQKLPVLLKNLLLH